MLEYILVVIALLFGLAFVDWLCETFFNKCKKCKHRRHNKVCWCCCEGD